MRYTRRLLHVRRGRRGARRQPVREVDGARQSIAGQSGPAPTGHTAVALLLISDPGRPGVAAVLTTQPLRGFPVHVVYRTPTRREPDARRYSCRVSCLLSRRQTGRISTCGAGLNRAPPNEPRATSPATCPGRTDRAWGACSRASCSRRAPIRGAGAGVTGSSPLCAPAGGAR